MSKYSLELKQIIVKEYLNGKSGGTYLLSRKYDIPVSTLKRWISKYKFNGIDSLKKKKTHKKYTGEFKLSVIKYRQINNTSFREAAQHFDLPNGSMVFNWYKRYKEEGFSGLTKRKGRPKKVMSKKENVDLNRPLNESEREELIRLREENEYLKLKEIYEKKLETLLWEKELEARKKQK